MNRRSFFRAVAGGAVVAASAPALSAAATTTYSNRDVGALNVESLEQALKDFEAMALHPMRTYTVQQYGLGISIPTHLVHPDSWFLSQKAAKQWQRNQAEMYDLAFNRSSKTGGA